MADIKRHISHLKSSGTTAPAAANLIDGEIAVGYGKGNEALYIKNSDGEIVTFLSSGATVSTAVAMANWYTDDRVITTITGDGIVSGSLNDVDVESTSGRTLTLAHKNDYTAQSGFKKLSTDTHGHVTGSADVELTDLTGLGAVSSARTVSAGEGLSGGGALSGDVTISHPTAITAGSTSSAAQTPDFGGTFNIPTISYDKFGHIIGTSTAAVTLPNESSQYISGITDGAGIDLAVTDGNLTAAHTNSITAGTAKTTSSTVTVTTTGDTITITRVEYDANGHITSAGTDSVTLKVNSASTSTAGVVQLVATTGNDETIVMTQKAVSDALAEKALAASAITSAEYDSTNKLIKFTNASGTQVDSIDATDFIKDGMVSNVEIKTIQSGEPASSVTVLAVTFNADAQTEEIDIPLTSIFNPSNYYTKSETSGKTELSTEFGLYYKKTETSGGTEISDALDLKANAADLTAHTSNTDIHVTTGDKATWNAKLDASDIADKVDNTVTVTGTNGLTGGGALTGNVSISHATAFTASAQTSPNANQNGTFGGTVNVPVISYDVYGHITAVTTTTITLPNSGSTWDNNYYITGGSVSTAATSSTINLNGNNSAASASVTLDGATTTAAGLMTAADKTKLEGLSSVEASTANNSGNAAGTITIGSSATTLYAKNEALTIGTSSATAVTYSPTSSQSLTFSASDKQNTSGLSITVTSGNIEVGLGDIVCGDYA